MSEPNWAEYPNFSRHEFACQCGNCGLAEMRPELMEMLQAIRTEAGFSFPVTSGYRCPAHNQAVSSTGADGPHTTGLAVDIGVRGDQCFRVMELAFEAGFKGIGVNQKGGSRFLHLDIITEGSRPWVWSY